MTILCELQLLLKKDCQFFFHVTNCVCSIDTFNIFFEKIRMHFELTTGAIKCAFITFVTACQNKSLCLHDSSLLSCFYTLCISV